MVKIRDIKGKNYKNVNEGLFPQLIFVRNQESTALQLKHDIDQT